MVKELAAEPGLSSEGSVEASFAHGLADLSPENVRGCDYVDLEAVTRVLADLAVLLGAESLPADFSDAAAEILRLHKERGGEIEALKLDVAGLEEELHKLRVDHEKNTDELKHYGTEPFSALEIDDGVRAEVVDTLREAGSVLGRVVGQRELGRRALESASTLESRPIVPVTEYYAPEDELA